MQQIFDDIKDSFFANERLNELEQLAKEKGFEFRKRSPFAEQAYKLKSFEIFKGKKPKRIKGVLSVEDEKLKYKIRIYDYTFYGNAGKKLTTIFEVFYPKLDLSKFEIHPKGRIKKMKEIFIEDPKIFAFLTNFHNHYEIQAQDIESLKFEINEDFLDLLSPQDKIRIEGEGDYLLMYFRHKQIPTTEIMKYYELLLSLIDRLINGLSNESLV